MYLYWHQPLNVSGISTLTFVFPHNAVVVKTRASVPVVHLPVLHPIILL